MQSVNNATYTCSSHKFELHMLPFYVSISSELLTPTQERLTAGVTFGQEIHRDRDFHRSHCVYNGCRDRQLH